jgi:hypothetical protein
MGALRIGSIVLIIFGVCGLALSTRST